MPRERFIEVGALNLNANPHPSGIYIRLLRRAERFLVKARGSDYAKITSPRKAERGDHVYTGRVLMWTEIDLKGAWLDLRNQDELARELKASINIPENARPNYRAFDYVYDDAKHTVYVQTRNELGARLGITTVHRIFAQLLSQELMGLDEPEVTVTIVPEPGAVDRILTLPGLRVLEFRVSRPNADVASPAARKRVFAELDAANAQRLEQRYIKSAKAERLTPTAEMQDIIEVAAETGYVKGEGRDLNDKPVEVSTVEYPKRWYISMEAGASFLGRLLSQIKLF
jgi:hypothetical protein